MFKSIDWVKQIALQMWVGLVQSGEGLNRTRRGGNSTSKLPSNSNCSLISSRSLQTARLMILDLPASIIIHSLNLSLSFCSFLLISVSLYLSQYILLVLFLWRTLTNTSIYITLRDDEPPWKPEFKLCM